MISNRLTPGEWAAAGALLLMGVFLAAAAVLAIPYAVELAPHGPTLDNVADLSAVLAAAIGLPLAAVAVYYLRRIAGVIRP